VEGYGNTTLRDGLPLTDFYRPMTISGNAPRWLTRSLRVAVALALAGAASWYSPWCTATFWHLFHPRGWVEYRGLRVRVPWLWTADTEAAEADPTATPLGLSLKKRPPTMDSRLPPQSVFVTVISPDPGITAERQTQAWLAMFRQSHPGADFEAPSPSALPAGASCLGAEKRSKPDDVVWTCISVPGGWVADFEGRRQDAPIFFEIASELRR
jgi:hypothetical protein